MSTEFITDVITPQRLTGVVRSDVVKGRPFDPWLPPKRVDDIEYELENFDARNGVGIARYRSWDAAPPLAGRPGISIIGGEIPVMGLSRELTEKDIIRLNKIRAGVAEASDSRVLDTMYNDAAFTADAVNNRITIAQADVLVDGAVTIESSRDGSAVVADFNVPSSHKGVTPSGAAWTDHTSSVPVTDLRAWHTTFRSHNGNRDPDFWITSTTVLNDLALNAQIRSMVPATPDGGTQPVVTDQTVAQVLKMRGIAPIVAVDLELPTMDDETVWARVLPERSIIGIIVSTLGNTLFGPSPNAALLAGNGQLQFSDANGVIAFAEQSIRPAHVLTTSEAVVLPVLRDPNAVFSATV